MLTFEPFRIWYDRQRNPETGKKKKKTELYGDCGFSSNTGAKIWNDDFPVLSDTIETICRVYGLRIDQVLEYRRLGKNEIPEPHHPKHRSHSEDIPRRSQ
ncbi:helix-turn-helix domain-containing protein [Ferviditalea candida]|uniref:helix-turn-helix domain-containing protein n=1 Tax=Ferviditalea candida TaxID=3108399 RepID=UPI00352C5475